MAISLGVYPIFRHTHMWTWWFSHGFWSYFQTNPDGCSNKGLRPVWLRLEHKIHQGFRHFLSWGTWYETKKIGASENGWVIPSKLPIYLENDELRQIREKATCSIPKTWNVYESSVLWIIFGHFWTLLQKLVWYWIWHSNNDHEFDMTGRYREMGFLSIWSKVGKHLHRCGKEFMLWTILWFPLGPFSIPMGFENSWWSPKKNCLPHWRCSDFLWFENNILLCPAWCPLSMVPRWQNALIIWSSLFCPYESITTWSLRKLGIHL